MTGAPATAYGPAPALTLGPALQHLLSVVVVAGAIKLPLDIPLYWNAALLLVGLFGVVCLQTLPRILLWMILLVGLGLVEGMAGGVEVDAILRLGQLFLLVMAASVIARLDCDLLIHYVALLVPVIVLVAVVELLLPEPLFFRVFLGEIVQRHGGIYGDPNYSAILYGLIGLFLIRRTPRVLAVPPLLLTVPTLSRGVFVALFAWLVVLAAGRFRGRISIAITILLLLQPVAVYLVLAAIDEDTHTALVTASSERLYIWAAYLQMGLEQPLGVGYFVGPGLVPELTPLGTERFAHSLFLQVFGEFGWLGYLVFTGFVLHLTIRLARHCPDELPLLIFLLSGYALVNGLSDWAFWVPVGYFLARLRLATGAP